MIGIVLSLVGAFFPELTKKNTGKGQAEFKTFKLIGSLRWLIVITGSLLTIGSLVIAYQENTQHQTEIHINKITNE